MISARNMRGSPGPATSKRMGQTPPGGQTRSPRAGERGRPGGWSGGARPPARTPHTRRSEAGCLVPERRARPSRAAWSRGRAGAAAGARSEHARGAGSPTAAPGEEGFPGSRPPPPPGLGSAERVVGDSWRA